MNICVFLSSSDAVDQHYVDLTRDLGKQIGERGHNLVFGGNCTGLMRHVADAVKASGGRVIGVVPRKLHELGRAYMDCDELIISNDLRDRKAIMDEKSDAFIALPGGLGTLEEIIEVLNLKYLRYHQKPVIFLNHRAFYEPLFNAFGPFYEERFTKKAIQQLYAAISTVDEVFPYLDSYVPVQVEEKWYDRSTDDI